MISINDAQTTTFEDLKHLGIGIKTFGRGNHIGLIYKLDDKDQVFLLHLEGHLELVNEPSPPNDGYFWIQAYNLNQNGVTEANLDDEDLAKLLNLAMYCELIATENKLGQIPYGMGYPMNCFDSNGKWNYDSKGEGLTCATFVMTVFESHGFSLLDINTWQNREDDTKWQNFVIDFLIDKGADREYIEEQRKKVGKAFRFRPEEVAAGVIESNRPVNFSMACKIGAEINNHIGYS